jgi:zinc protease
MTSPERYQLPNGLTVVLQPSHAAKVVALQAWVSVGSADEPPELAGIAHVFEHMLFKGTQRRGVGQIAREIESAGGEINAWTSFDQTVYHLVLASRFFPLGLDILADALLHSSFDAGELKRELKVVLEEIKQGEDNPSRVASQALFGAAYKRHPYRRPVIGSERTVRTFTRARLVDFFRRHYVASNLTLVVVGDFSTEEARRLILHKLGSAPKRPPLKRRPVREPTRKRPRVVVKAHDVREVYLSIAFPIPGIRHPDTAALDVLSILVGQGDSARLTRAVKRQAQLVSDVYAYSYTPRDPGLLVAGATLSVEKLEAAFDAILAELFRLRESEVTSDELAKARAIIEADTIYQKETVQGQARKLGFFETVAGGLGFEDEYLRAVRELRPSELREVATRYLACEHATACVLLPAQSSDAARLQVSLDKKLRAKSQVGHRIARAQPRKSDEVEVIRSTLEGGARLLVARDPSVKLCAVRAAFMGGLRYEDSELSGINNLLAALVTRGTAHRSGDELAHEVEAMAGAIGGFCGKNSFGLRMELVSSHWARGLELFADCLTKPALADDEIEKERRLVLEEIRTQEDNVSAEAFRLFAQTLYRAHPYRLDLHGTAQSVGALDRKRLCDYFAAHVRPSEMTLAVVGDVDPQAVLEQVSALFAALPSSPTPERPVPLVEPPPVQPIEVERIQNKQQAHVVYGFSGTTIRSPDRFPLEVLSTILSGQSGRLFLELRDRQALAYRVSAFSVEGVDPGYFAVYVATSPENRERAVLGIQRELDRMRERKVPKVELERAQRYLVGAHEISLQRRAALASTLAFHECYGVGWDEYRRYAPAVLAVTADDVQRVAHSYLDPGRAILATIRPESVGAVSRSTGAAAVRVR